MNEIMVCICPDCGKEQDIYLFGDSESMQDCLECGTSMSENDWARYELTPDDEEREL